jgi:hypothetical protein
MKSFRQLLENNEKWIGTDKHNVSTTSEDIKEFPHIHKPVELSTDEKMALKSYAGSKHEPINRLLRGMPQLHEHDKIYAENYAPVDIKDLKSALSRHTTEHHAHVWRGISNKGATSLDLHNMEPGTILHDKGFVSTSLAPVVARDFSGNHVFHIKLPKGSKALYRNHYNFASGEHEVILPPDSKFRYLGKEEMPSGRVIHRMEHIPE